MQYFEGLTLESEIKARYKELAKQNHPDLGGSLEVMKEINVQYEKVMTGAYQKEGKSITEIDELLAKDQALRTQLLKILHLEGLIIELCGCWLWITGETRTHKEALKTSGCLWSSKKCAWYWRAEEKKGWFHRNEYDLEAIRYKHGSMKLERRQYVQVG